MESLGHPYVEPNIKRSRDKRPTTIEFSLSQTTSDKAAALAIALHQHNNPLEPYDYIVDDEQIIECAKVLGRNIRVLICAQPHEIEPLWEDAVARPVLYQTADLVATLCHVYKIPDRYVLHTTRRRRKGGLINLTVGTFPSESFLLNVQSNLKRIKESQ